MMKNYYDTLQLKRDASDFEIADSYKRMVLHWHPKLCKEDNKTAHHNFSEISEAYEVLSDPLKRSFYDKYGYVKLKEGLFAEGQLKGGYRFGNNPDQIFEQFFYEHNELAKLVDDQLRQQGSIFSHAFGGLNYVLHEQLEDLVLEVPCTLNELYMGVAKSINFERRILNADGKTTELQSQRKLLEIKPGYGAQTILVFRGEGHQNVRRQYSNLLIKIKEIADPNFKRQGNDLIYAMNISLADAIDCKCLYLSTLNNRKLRVSADSIIEPRCLQKIDGQGMPTPSGKRGNLYIKFNIIFPQQITESIKVQLRTLLP